MKRVFSMISATNGRVKTAANNFVKTFKPSYSVVVTMYHVIPGLPVKRNATKHEFGKGSYNTAVNFFEKVVDKTKEIKLAPAEIHLVKGKKKVVQKVYFGPVPELKKMRMSA